MSAFSSPIKRMRPLLGTFVEIKLPNKASPNAFNAAFQAIEQVQQRMSYHDKNSELSLFNQSSHLWFACSHELYQVLQIGWQLQRASQNAFNLFTGNVLEQYQVLPRHCGCEKKLKSESESLSEAPKIQFTCRNHQYFIHKNTSQRICLDGIAKGFALEKAKQALQQHNIKNGLINAGGDILAFGETAHEIQIKSTATDCKITADKTQTVQIQNQAIATSEQNPKTAYRYPSLIFNTEHQPVAPQRISVIAQDATYADAFTKIFMNTPYSQHTILCKRYQCQVIYERKEHQTLNGSAA